MSTCHHVAFFAVFVDVEALPLDLRRSSETDCSPHERTNDGASHHGERDRDHDCFQLLDPERVAHDSCQTILRSWIDRAGGAQQKIRIYARRRKDAGEKRAECSTYSVNSERIERIVVAEPGFEFCACKKRNHSSRNPDHNCAARPDVSASPSNP